MRRTAPEEHNDCGAGIRQVGVSAPGAGAGRQLGEFGDQRIYARIIGWIMSSSPPRHHEVTRPVPQQFNPAAGNAPLAALISALSSVAQASTSQPAPIGQGTNDAHFTARLCSALSLRPDSLLSNFQRQKVVQNASATSARVTSSAV